MNRKSVDFFFTEKVKYTVLLIYLPYVFLPPTEINIVRGKGEV